MRRLNRPSRSSVQCLANYNYNNQKWSLKSPNSVCRTDIWGQLDAMQGGFCAYCEATLNKGDRHIEHFFHKGKLSNGTAPYKHLTFDWNNLFGCCGRYSSDTCGHYKDREGNKGPGSYNPNDLIKPDIKDPRDFLTFQDTGKVGPKNGLTSNNLKRANETIRVLHLDFPALNAARERQIKIFKRELNNLALISNKLDDDSLSRELANIKSRAVQSEFQTAILDSLGLSGA